MGESYDSWISKIKASDLVNALYGANVPAATRAELVKQIEAGTLDRKDFTGAFLTAKVTDGITVPTVNDIVARADSLNLTPTTLQFDDDHVLTHIYLGAFGRAPDGDGLAYWKAKVDEIGIARTTQALYQGGLENGELDSNVSNTAFVTNFYQSILGRTPDAPGLAFWVEKLDAGHLDRGFAIHAFVEGTSDGRDAKYVNNKALVAQAFAGATKGKTADEAMLKAAKEVLANVNEKDATALAALDAIANGSALKASATTAKLVTLDWLDTRAGLLFDDDAANDQDAVADEAADAAGIELVGITTDDAAALL